MLKNATREQNKKQRNLKKKVYKLNYLNEELEDVLQTVSEYSQEFRDILTTWLKSNNSDCAIDDIFPSLKEKNIVEIDNEEEIEKEVKIDKWVKEIYHQIANKTHPDKLSQKKDIDITRKLYLENIFIKSNNFFKENNGPALYSIAIELGLKIKNIPDNIIEHFDKRLSLIDRKIEMNKNSHIWYWAESSLEQKILFIKNINKKYQIDANEETIALFLSDYI